MTPYAIARPPYMPIPVDPEHQELPFCNDLAGQHMRCAVMENTEAAPCTVHIEGTNQFYPLEGFERLPCVISEDVRVVHAQKRVQIRDKKLTFLNSSMPVFYDGHFRFYRNGVMEVPGKHGRFTIRFSDQGFPFVYARDGAAIDCVGNVKTMDDMTQPFQDCRFTHQDPCPQKQQYLLAIYEEGIGAPTKAGITTDRKVFYQGNCITGIPDPVVDITITGTGLWILTSRGELYLTHTDHKGDAFLVAKDVIAISSGSDSQYFVFADQAGDLHVYDGYYCRLRVEENRSYLEDRNSSQHKEYQPRILHPGRGRICEICVLDKCAAFLCVSGSHGTIRLNESKTNIDTW